MTRDGVPGKQCSSGYMGGQVWADGSVHVLFSLWDYNVSLKTAYGLVPSTDNGLHGCSNFGGEGTGAHCGATLPGWEPGVRYTFRAWLNDSHATHLNFTGAVWQAAVANTHTGEVTSIGEIFVRDDFLGGPDTSQCGVMPVGAYSFQEYFLGGDFYTAATWRGPVFSASTGSQDDSVHAVDAVECCFDLKHVWSPGGRNVSLNNTNRICRPPDCDEVEVFFAGGIFPLDQYSDRADSCGVRECRATEDFCPRVGSPGHGGCANATTGYPTPINAVPIFVDTMADCEARCVSTGNSCVGFAYCDGANCNRSCTLYPGPLGMYDRQNGYPSTTCYLRPQGWRPADAAKSAAKSRDANRPVSIGVYQGAGTSEPGSNSAYFSTLALSAEMAFGLGGFIISNLTEHDVSTLVPWGSPGSSHDIVAFPGGSGRGQATAIGEDGLSAIRAFVKAGGAYLGTCGGAFLGIQHIKFYGDGPDGLGPPTEEPWDRGHGEVEVGFTAAGVTDFQLAPAKYSGRNVTLTYWQGPIVKNASLPIEVVRFAWYRTEIHSLHTNETKGEMVNTPAITGLTSYAGGGKVVLTSPHPELSPTDPAIYKGELLWSAPNRG